ncbi:ATP/GTP-binding protein [Haloferula sp. A504]|uniref:ATP/GTP-binding protein n=1 Tax=Haloferula sp. A504 TaxID=3373601 RepID=UPI0031BCD186|nr:ATP-binding protein [Verrucomicrobiaceae bacterium E54]
MIIRYTFRNFYSFAEETEVDFTVGLRAGDRPGIVETEAGYRVNHVTGVFGANASGKTNLLKPLGFLAWFVLDSARAKPGSEILFEAFAFGDGDGERPTEIAVEFEFGGGHYLYEATFRRDRVLSESLHRKKTRFSYLFERIWDEEAGEYEFKAQDIGPAAQVPLRANASWLSSALLQEHELALRLHPFFLSLHGNLGPDGRTPLHDAEFTNLVSAAEFFDADPETLRRASSLMAGFDLGLTKVRTERIKNTGPDGKEYEFTFPVAEHQVAGRNHLRALMQESRGTQALFVLLRYLLPVLESGGVAFIDEFESGLHPHMVRAIVDLFFNPATNPKDAQLIATFHTDFLLRDTLHKYQVYLVEKGDDLVSRAYRLDSFRKAKGGKAPRNVENLFEKYHAGSYGGVPEFS